MFDSRRVMWRKPVFIDFDGFGEFSESVWNSGGDTEADAEGLVGGE